MHVYLSQAHKGELVRGAGIDSCNGCGQRGSSHVVAEQMAAALELFPIFARAHMIRGWAGVVDVTPDASPIIGATPLENLFLICGWGTGGFKPPRPPVRCSRTPWPPEWRTRWPNRSGWPGSAPAR